MSLPSGVAVVDHWKYHPMPKTTLKEKATVAQVGRLVYCLAVSGFCSIPLLYLGTGHSVVGNELEYGLE